MSRVLSAVWENTYGLLVDDGQLAVGIVLALAFVWLLATYAGAAARDVGGWVLLALLIALKLANIYRAGQNARRRAARKDA